MADRTMRDIKLTTSGYEGTLYYVPIDVQLEHGWIIEDVPAAVSLEKAMSLFRQVTVAPVTGGVVVVPWTSLALAKPGDIVHGEPIL